MRTVRTRLPDAPAGCLRPARRRHAAAIVVLLGLALPAGDASATNDGVALRPALDAACRADGAPDPVLAALGGGIHLASEELDARAGLGALRHRLMLPDGSRLRLDTHHQGERLVQVILELAQRVNGVLVPKVWAVADGECRVRVARRLVYRPGGSPRRLDDLGPDLASVRSSQELDAAVPPGAVVDGVPVAMIDSGVNYTLEPIAARLARDATGRLLGFDYWDLDPRPFDSHPARSAFHPLRHGTRTASLLLQDAPVATVAPVRYPRPDMSRMTRVVDDIARAGITIANLSLGGRDALDWRAFEAAARAHPQMLFVVSAGNDGLDLDRSPLYPAALDLDNLITVTSADAQGLPARGSNWGRASVDLLVPAEGLVTTGFDGYARRVSGSSYAAVRVSALAACLLAANPGWQAPQLREAIFAMATRAVHPSLDYVRVGLLPAPPLLARGGCAAEPARAQRLGRLDLSAAALSPPGAHAPAARFVIAPLTLVWVEDAGWPLESLAPALARAAGIFAQCGVGFGPVTVELWRLPRDRRYFDTANALALMKTMQVPAPSVWFLRDTLQFPAFDAEAIGRSNGRGREPLMNSVWMTSHLEFPGIALAHELYHVLANSGGHVPETHNLMHGETSAGSTQLGDWQCQRLVEVGRAFGLIGSE